MGYTKGPWKAEGSKIVSMTEFLVDPLDDDDGKGIPITIVECYGAMGGDNTKADRQLLSAAPELLQALHAMLDLYEETTPVNERGWLDDGNHPYRLANKAIAKAEGKD